MILLSLTYGALFYGDLSNPHCGDWLGRPNLWKFDWLTGGNSRLYQACTQKVTFYLAYLSVIFATSRVFVDLLDLIPAIARRANGLPFIGHQLIGASLLSSGAASCYAGEATKSAIYSLTGAFFLITGHVSKDRISELCGTGIQKVYFVARRGLGAVSRSFGWLKSCFSSCTRRPHLD